MGMILRIASSRIVGQGDIVGRSGYFSLNLSANSVMRGRLDARRTLKSLVADLRYTTFCTGSKLGFFGFTFTPEGGATGITDSAVNKEVVATEYYNVVGMRLNEPAKGLNIIKRIMSDGSVETTKACIE